MNNDRMLDEWLRGKIEAALEQVDFGKIILNIHEKQVVSIDVSDRRREKRQEA